ncbi:hypothetical protein HPB48_000620 [Haemaphysalis longicornis]|uniref:Uncharacterized protein n=1 Tax=Haemaphysalis longicornis TaxID=44386 RepID=A0A9J6FIU8_HAELO|nr:hypothetical protein HPB48_000620 [Haemaphysalis longicornis]
MLAARGQLGLSKFDHSMCAQRWTSEHYNKSRGVLLAAEQEEPEPFIVDKQDSRPILSSHQKFRKASMVAGRIAGVVSEVSMAEFQRRMETLENLYSTGWLEMMYVSKLMQAKLALKMITVLVQALLLTSHAPCIQNLLKHPATLMWSPALPQQLKFPLTLLKPGCQRSPKCNEQMMQVSGLWHQLKLPRLLM